MSQIFNQNISGLARHMIVKWLLKNKFNIKIALKLGVSKLKISQLQIKI